MPVQGSLRSRSSTTRVDDRGFTLVELLVVIIIIGILSAIALPTFLNQRKKGWDSQARSDNRNLATLQEAYVVDKSSYVSVDSSSSMPAGMEDYKDTDGVLTKSGYVGAQGFCIISKSRSGLYFVYDSMNGGQERAGRASLGSWTAGTACSTAAPAMP
jgi:prepilin-type N-terminal cleavage/methylation domain-containing protein